MISHIVMFQPKSGLSDTERLAFAQIVVDLLLKSESIVLSSTLGS